MKTIWQILGVVVWGILCSSAFADPPYRADRMALLPFAVVGIDEISARSAETLLEMELRKRSGLEFISPMAVENQFPDQACHEVDCAATMAQQLNASHVVLCTLSRLGEKVLVQYMLVDAGSRQVLISDHTSSTTLEDLEAVMQRVALSLITLKPLSQTAEAGVIMEKETAEPRVRQSRRRNGFSFGYLYPQSGYDGEDRSFIMDYRMGYEMTDFTAGMLVGLRKGFAANIFFDYLLTRSDVCPYLGGSFGFHWVSHDEPYESHSEGEEKSGDGFQIGVQAGVRLFRTWNFTILLNSEYLYTFNDYDDQAVVITIGLLK